MRKSVGVSLIFFIFFFRKLENEPRRTDHCDNIIIECRIIG